MSMKIGEQKVITPKSIETHADAAMTDKESLRGPEQTMAGGWVHIKLLKKPGMLQWQLRGKHLSVEIV